MTTPAPSPAPSLRRFCIRALSLGDRLGLSVVACSALGIGLVIAGAMLEQGLYALTQLPM